MPPALVPNRALRSGGHEKPREGFEQKRHEAECEKAPCTDLPSDPTLHQIPSELRRRTRTSTTHTKHKRSACSRKTN